MVTTIVMMMIISLVIINRLSSEPQGTQYCDDNDYGADAVADDDEDDNDDDENDNGENDCDENITCYYKQGDHRALREPISLPATVPRDSS